MNITDFLNSDYGSQIIKGISNNSGATPQETSSVVNAAAPLLMGMLQKNASTDQGAAGILGALTKHDGSILDNLSGFFGSGDTSDGDGILGHVLGSKRDTVENALSQKTGVSAGKVTGILAMLAPIIMGYLGKQTRTQGNVSNSSGLGGLLGGLMGSSGGGGLLSSLLDQDGDGKLDINDAISAVTGKKSGGLGGLLGGLFGKK